MSAVQAKLGEALLSSLMNLRQQKGEFSLEDVGNMFVSMASTLHPQESDHGMHEEIRLLADYISSAKTEIFAISSNDKSEQAIMDASQHLDAVIKSTEEATTIIMDAADSIQHAANGIGGDAEPKIIDATTRIYEACNFQDITGQRITNVIKLLNNIEERVGKLTALFGNENDISTKPGDKKVIMMDDKALLNGPQLNAVSQNDIDALFSSLGSKN